MSIADKYLSFSGRLRRRDWWLLSIALGLLAFAIGQAIVAGLYGTGYTAFGRAEDKLSHMPSLGIQAIMSLITLWPSLALSAKRTHDRDKSATVNMVLVVLTTLFGVGQPLYMAYTGGSPEEMAMKLIIPSLISLVISLYLLVTLGFLDGTPDDNRFGPSPKAEPMDETLA